ncbi:MAG: tetratricopeptide repeat protein [Chloroflexi bacterium]|nr:tetratricopeptide repeat protein [Chloroflexota bacterium]
MADFSSLEAVAHDAAALPVPVPGNLIGRDVTLAHVYRQLKENKAVLLYGPPGIGKTALAAKLASAFAELPGGVLWFTSDEMPLAEMIARIGRVYHLPEVATSENPITVVEAAFEHLLRRKPLIVIDGRLGTQAITEVVMRVASELPVLMLNPEELEGPWTALRLGRLEAEAATTLFKQLLAHQPGQPEDYIPQLVKAFDYAPLALAIAAGAIRAGSPQAFIGEMSRAQSSGATPQLLALTAAFRSLNNALQGLLLVLGAIPGGRGSAELISMIGGAPLASIQPAMQMLVDRYLVEAVTRFDQPYYHLHPIIASFTQSWLRGSGRLEGLQAKVRDSLLNYARSYSTEDDAAHNKLALEMDTFMVTARAAAEEGERDFANQLVSSLSDAGNFISARGYVYEFLQLRELAASSTSAFPAYDGALPPSPPPLTTTPEPEPDEIGIAVDLDEVDLVEDDGSEIAFDEDDGALLDDYIADLEEDLVEADDEASAVPTISTQPGITPTAVPLSELDRLRAALERARQNDDKRTQASILNSIARIQAAQGEDASAINNHTAALSLYETLNDSFGELTNLDALAALSVKTDNPQAAILHASRGVEVARRLGNQEVVEIRLLTLLGDTYQQLGESEKALNAYGKALELARGSADPGERAVLISKLGFAQLDHGEPSQAIRTWEMVLPDLREHGRTDFEGRVLGGLGTASGELGRWSEAIPYHTSALHITRTAGDKAEEAIQLSNLGYAAVQINDLKNAALRYRQALHLAYESGDPNHIVSSTVDLARLLLQSVRYLDIVELLVDYALQTEPDDRDLRQIKTQIAETRAEVGADLQPAPVGGTARDYAANAYKLLDS